LRSSGGKGKRRKWSATWTTASRSGVKDPTARKQTPIRKCLVGAASCLSIHVSNIHMTHYRRHTADS
jgi:hypothetical protein